MRVDEFPDANCREPGASPHDWFPDFVGKSILQIQVRAMDLCQDCPHTKRCAEIALDISGVTGIWAGIYVPAAVKAGRRGAVSNLRRIADAKEIRKPRGLMRVKPPKVREPRPCTECPNITVPKTTPVAEMGNYVRYGADGLCSACYQRLVRRRKKNAP